MEKRIKVLYVETWREIGGGQLGLVDFVQSIDKTLFEPVVILPALKGALYERLTGVEGVTIRPFQFDFVTPVFGEHPFSPVLAPFSVGRLAREISRVGADVVHANQIHAGKYVCPAARSVGKPNIVTIRNVYWRKRFGIHRFVDALLSRNADYVVFNSQRGCDEYAMRSGASNALAIQNGINVDAFLPEMYVDMEVRDRYAIPRGKRICTTVAKLTKAKGHEVLMAAIPRILKRFHDVHFVFVGDEYPGSNMETELRGLAEVEGVRDNISWLGFSDDVPALLSISTCTVLPSVQGEGMPRAVIESMAAGVPPVASDLAAMPEVVIDGVCGYLCKPRDPEGLADNVCKLLSLEPDQYQAMKSKSQKRAQLAFSRRQMIKQYMRLYTVLVSQRRPELKTWYRSNDDRGGIDSQHAAA